MRTRRIAASLAATVVAMTTVVSAAQAAPHHDGRHGGAGSSPGRGAGFDHIFVIMLENHSQSSVIDDPNAPYITSLAHTLRDGRPLLRRHAPVDAELHRRDRRRQLRHPGRQRPERRQPRPAATSSTSSRPSTSAGTPTWRPCRPTSWTASARRSTATRLAVRQEAQPVRAVRRRQEQPGPDGHVTRLQPARRRPEQPARARSSCGSRPNQCNDMHGGVYDAVAGHPETPCPYGSTKDDANDAALKQKADAFVHGAVETITQLEGLDQALGDRDRHRRERLHRQRRDRWLGERGRLLRLAVRRGRRPAGLARPGPAAPTAAA